MKNVISYFDGHNDILSKLYYSNNDNISEDFYNGNDDYHIDYPKITNSNFIGGFFAIFVSEKKPKKINNKINLEKTYNYKLGNSISYSHAINATNSMISILEKIILDSKGKIVLCKNGEDLINAYKNNKISIILHIEGAEAIDKNFDSLENLHSKGLRSLGIVWSRSNDFAHGVPFSFPNTPNIGLGLTKLGKELIKKCNEMKILIDLSHLNEKGFWDVVKLSHQPLMATHSNVHKLCNHSRNLTNNQLKAIKESNGIVGLNFVTGFLRSDGQMNENTDLEIILKHLDHLIENLGEEKVAIGSDFDGAIMPTKIKNLSGVINLINFMKKNGYDEKLIKKIFFKNWLNFLETNL